jgi:hypothetical protein
MGQYSFWLTRFVSSYLFVGQQAIQRLNLGLIHENGTAQSTLPILRFAGEDMAPSRLSPDQLSGAGAGKSFLGSTVGFHFPVFHVAASFG